MGIQIHALAVYPPKIYLIPIAEVAGLASGPVWMGSENLALTEFRIPDRPTT
jgi:hypothetical protein